MNVMEHPPRGDTREAAPASRPEPAEAPPPAPGSRLWLWLAALGGAGLALGLYLYQADHAVPDPAPPVAVAARSDGLFQLNDAEMRALRIEPIAAQAFRDERVAEGRIAVNDDRATPMFAPYTGRVTRAFARAGERVEVGQPLYEIETPDVTGAANELLAAADGLQKARVAADQARREEARQASMLAARAASLRDVEQARAALAAAEADHRSAAAALDAARDRLRVLGRSAADIAAIEQSRQVSGLITVTAPLAGTVTQRRLGPGQWLTAGQGEPVFTIADLSSVWLVAQVREADAPAIRTGQPVEVEVGALPGRRFPARIVRSAAGLDPATRRLMVMAEVEDPEGVLRPEMFANFRIEVGPAREGPAVPMSAVIFRGREAHVWVALPGNRFELRHIEAGIRDGAMIEAREGLTAGERVVTGGALFIDRAARIE
ncbi:MAG: efflux RND transporter periplasmic adaptor subunit [Rubritepida sp.]|nr:efflux RND transporter periplasmic adaptor subunit [Rubritepida sp.]